MYHGNSQHLNKVQCKGHTVFRRLGHSRCFSCLGCSAKKATNPFKPLTIQIKKNSISHSDSATSGENPHLHREVSEHCQPKRLIIIIIIKLVLRGPLTSMVRHSRAFSSAGRSKSVTARLPLGDLKCKPCKTNCIGELEKAQEEQGANGSTAIDDDRAP